SDSSDSSESSSSSSSSSSAPSIRVKGKKKTQHSITQQQRQSPSPPPETANDAFIPSSIFNDTSGASSKQLPVADIYTPENPLRAAFKSQWMASIADNFSGDLEKLSAEPHMNGDKLRLLIAALSTNSTAIRDDEAELVLSSHSPHSQNNRDSQEDTQDTKMEE
ncbi:hypothetical protein E3P96_02023, partial [Wallemia ichthyophaga]